MLVHAITSCEILSYFTGFPAFLLLSRELAFALKRISKIFKYKYGRANIHSTMNRNAIVLRPNDEISLLS